MGLILIIFGIGAIGALVTRQLRSRMMAYAQIPSKSGLTGRQIAERMLADYGIDDVQIVEGKGFLTDHYHPQKNVITLSPDIYRGRHLAAAAVAAHETGHAVQDYTGYGALRLRTAMVPIIQGAGKLQRVLLVGAVLLFSSFPQLLLILVGTYALTTLFSLLTLPVELDASRRALDWLEHGDYTYADDQALYRSALRWAASTYVVQAISAIAILAYFAWGFVRGRN